VAFQKLTDARDRKLQFNREIEKLMAERDEVDSMDKRVRISREMEKLMAPMFPTAGYGMVPHLGKKTPFSRTPSTICSTNLLITILIIISSYSSSLSYHYYYYCCLHLGHPQFFQFI
jgi:hypothetical protein